jgi:outer membrane protein OmpA-like peptidoglycan-associated protein
VSAKEDCRAFRAWSPPIRIEVPSRGHTDNVGETTLNQKLANPRREPCGTTSSSRAPAESISAEGLGDADPVASNNTSEGRAQNRRVEIIVSGDVIGTTLGK